MFSLKHFAIGAAVMFGFSAVVAVFGLTIATVVTTAVGGFMVGLFFPDQIDRFTQSLKDDLGI